MPDTPRPAEFAALPNFEDAKYYSVQLYRAVERAGRHLTPASRLVLRGDVAKELAEAIYTAEETAAP